MASFSQTMPAREKAGAAEVSVVCMIFFPYDVMMEWVVDRSSVAAS
jgi:hypothetical protein